MSKRNKRMWLISLAVSVFLLGGLQVHAEEPLETAPESQLESENEVKLEEEQQGLPQETLPSSEFTGDKHESDGLSDPATETDEEESLEGDGKENSSEGYTEPQGGQTMENETEVDEEIADAGEDLGMEGSSEGSTDVTDDDTEDEEDNSEVMLMSAANGGEEQPQKDGWVTENGKTYYYKNGEAVKGELWDGKYWYFFDLTTGERKQNQFAWIPELKKNCYYDGNGHMLYGEQCINGGWYYLTPYTGAVDYEFAWIPNLNKWVYYGPEGGDGRMRYGEQYIDGGWYYLTPVTGAVDYDWAWIPNLDKWVYYDSITGRMQYGQKKIDNKWYFFDEITGRVYSDQEVANRLVQTAYAVRGTSVDVVAALREKGGSICPYGPCMTFVWYIFQKAGLSGFLADGMNSGWPHDAYNWYRSHGRYSTVPQVGDILFMRWNGWADSIGASSSHAGIVVGVSQYGVTTIDAMSDGHGPHFYSFGHPALQGFGKAFY